MQSLFLRGGWIRNTGNGEQSQQNKNSPILFAILVYWLANFTSLDYTALDGFLQKRRDFR